MRKYLHEHEFVSVSEKSRDFKFKELVFSEGEASKVEFRWLKLTR